MEFEVLVQLKGEVLDPEARAIHEALKHQGVNGVSEVSVAKRFTVKLNKDCKNPEQTINDIASQYLANPVAQTFVVKRLNQ